MHCGDAFSYSTMPTHEVYLPQGHSDQRKASLIPGLTQATVDAIGAPAESVRTLLSELPASNIGLGGKLTPAALPVIILWRYGKIEARVGRALTVPPAVTNEAGSHDGQDH